MWSQCVLAALADVLAHNGAQAWADLMALPKMVLPTARARGGEGHRGRVAAETKQRCRNWLEGHRQQLWQRPQARQNHQQRATERSAQRVEERVVELLRDGLLQKGCSALVQTPPAEVTPDIVAEMLAKHPAARSEDADRRDSLRPVAGAAAFQADVEAVAKALSSFSRPSGAGPSGLRAQHLKEALVPGTRDEVLRRLTKVVNLMARGDVPNEVQTWLCGALLVALPKEEGRHRPVAVGEALRRLTGKVLCSVSSE